MRLPSPPPAEFAALKQREVVVNGVRVSYTEAGDGPPVLLLHGAVFAGNVFWWETQAALAPHARTYAPDYPGWGASEKPYKQYHMEEYHDFVIGFMDALGLEKVAIVGHSLGGLVGSSFTLFNPERVSSLTILAAPPAWADFGVPSLFQPFLTPVLGEFLMWMTPLAGVGHPLGIRRYYEGLFHNPSLVPGARMREMLEGCVAATAEAAHRHAFLNTMRSSEVYLRPRERYRIKAMLSDCPVPMQVIAGRQDPLFALSMIERAAAEHTRAKFVVLDDCGHFPTWEQPERVAELVSSFAGLNAVPAH
jgi:pimeloyl-ACP methyl ester carboxylesterase